MYGTLDISTSGMVASRVRLEVATANITNSRTITGPDGEYAPFRRRMAVIASGDPASGSDLGVHVNQIIQNDGPLRMEHDPEHVFANADGYVGYPDIDSSIEQVNALEATRAYEANIVAAEATKSMVSLALRILA